VSPPLSKPFLDDFLGFLRANSSTLSKEMIAREKRRLCEEYHIVDIPTDIWILAHLDAAQLAFATPFLLSKPVRSRSGVLVVAIMTRPSRCPHGRCSYCPGGLSSEFGDVPQSYTGHEPASMRGARASYDAYLQVFSRLEQYVIGGHDPQKVELIIMGGTFPGEEASYQESFVREAFQALNDFSGHFYRDGGLDVERFREFFLLPGSVYDEQRVASVASRILELKASRHGSLDDAHARNESAYVRSVGLTVETRPDYARLAHAQALLRLGCTRVELGVQTVFDDVLVNVCRGHTVEDSVDAAAVLRDLGFKLNFHLMLGLPGMTPERDLAAMRTLFEDPRFRPDMLKIYPCMVLKGTDLHQQFLAGRFTPISTEDAAELLARALPLVPRYCRVMRIQRDIPTNVTVAGVDRTNLRQIVEEKMRALGRRSLDIHAREIRGRPFQKAVLNVIGYEAADGEEYFLSFDDPTQDALLGFCRLRFPARQLGPEFDVRTAIVRELHVYGKAMALGALGADGSAQHRGFGRELLAVAERIARENGKRKLLVISGVGARQYYEKLGYRRDGPYMGKIL
jgi:elongator complex protein 3